MRFPGLRTTLPAALALAASCAWAFNPPASPREPVKPAEVSRRAECNTTVPTGAGNRCLSLRIPFGRLAHAPELSGGYLSLECDRADPRMYTPQGLEYRLYAFSTLGAVSGSDVTVVQANGTPVTFRFPSGASVGAPVNRETGVPNRLQRLASDGNPTNTAAAYYDHWYSDGSRVRLSAATGKSVSVTTAAGREVAAASCGVTVARSADGGLRQVWSAADGLADVYVTVSNAVYEIRFYAAADVGASTNGAGLRTVSGAPVAVWRISNPDAATGVATRLVAVEDNGTFALTNEWRYIQAVDDWVLDQSGGERRTLQTAEWNADKTQKWQRQTVYGPDGKTLASSQATLWKKQTWGMAEEETVTDPQGLNLAVTRSYYEDPSQTGRYTQPKAVTCPDGSWEAFDYDAQGRVTLKVTPWLGQPASPSGQTAAQLAAAGLAVSYTYAPLAAGDTPGLVDARPRTVETKVAGTPVARSYAAYIREADLSLTEIRETCTDLSAAYGAASSLRTETRRYSPTDANAAAASRVKSVLGADGVLRTFGYAAGTWTGPLADPGNAAAFAEAAGGAALKTTVTEGTPASPDGIPGKTLRTVTYADAQGNAVLSEVHARNDTAFSRISWTAAAYDAFRNPTGRVDSAGYASSASWAGRDLPVAAADGFGLAYAYGYDALGRLVTEVRLPAGGSPAVTNAFAYDALDRVTEASVASGGFSRRLLAAFYDRAGRPASFTDADGRTAAFAYADGGRTVTETLPGGGTLVGSFWPGGAPRSVTGAAAAPPVWYSYGLENGKLWTRASAGSENSPATVTRHADPAGRTVSVRHADGLAESLAYDLAGRLTNALDRAGSATRFNWDGAGNPLSVERQADAGFAKVSFGLDLAALTESVTNEAGALISLSVSDVPGRKVTDTGIDGLPEVTRFAAGGRVASVSRRDGVLVSNVWDAAGRLAQVRHGGTPVLGIAWRADGLPLSASNAAASVSWTYDVVGRATNESLGIGSSAFSVRRSLSSSALATNFTLSVGSWELRVERSFDPAERLSSLSGPAGTFGIAYGSTNGLPESVTNAALSGYCAYDLVGRLTNTVFRNAAGTAVGSFRYRYDASGMVTQKVSAVNGSASTNAYAYDALGRLTNEISRSGGTSTNRFTYDAAGNRLTAGAASFTYANNRLVSANNPATTVAYDASGNVTNTARAGASRSLAWNTLGQLVSVSTNGALAESYTYDPLGRRASTVAGGTAVYHIYIGDQCAADLDSSGKPLRSYAWGPGVDNLLALTVYGTGATNSYYAVKDHLGSVHALVNTAGAVVESYTYDAWGVTVIRNAGGAAIPASAYGNRFLFQGREYSAATGLYNFRARWYAPELGRWLSPDPIGLEGGLNLYEFCANNPVNFRDPSGELSAIQAYDYWSEVAGNGISEGGVSGYATAAGAILMNTFIDLLGARSIEENSRLSGEYSVYDGCQWEAWKYGGLAAGQIAMDAFMAANAMKAARLARAPNNFARNRALHEQYTDQLRRQMSKPHTTNPELTNLMDDLYRPGAKVGSGSTADAVRHELATGELVNGRTHITKAQEYSTAISDWMKANPTASGADRAAAENVLRDLGNALGGN